jgi:hypothetical protein
MPWRQGARARWLPILQGYGGGGRCGGAARPSTRAGLGQLKEGEEEYMAWFVHVVGGSAANRVNSNTWSLSSVNSVYGADCPTGLIQRLATDA